MIDDPRSDLDPARAVAREPLRAEPPDAGLDDGSADRLEHSLVAARGGDQVAFAALYRDLHPRLLRYATVLVGQDAEDVVADAWLQIARDLGRFEGAVPNFRAWTARIVRNRALDHARAQARRPRHTSGLSSVLDRPSPEDTEQSAADAMSTYAALALIATLPRHQAEAVLLRAVVGLDPAGAGKVLGKRPGAVRASAHRGLRTLEAQLRRREDQS